MHPLDRMTPSDISKFMIGKHLALGVKFDELSCIARTSRAAGLSERGRVLGLTHQLCSELASQIAFEATVLLPALRDADAWGEVRADKLIARLRARRKELRHFRKSYARVDRAMLGQAIDRFIIDQRADMVHAQRYVVHENILRDDVLGIDVHGG